MSGSDDETKKLIDKTEQPSSSNVNAPSPYQAIPLPTNTLATSSASTNSDFVQEMDIINNSTSNSRPANYGYLEHIQSIKLSLTPEGKSKKKKVKEYYTQQLQLVTSIEDVLEPKTSEHKNHATAYEKRMKRQTEILSLAVLVTNAILVVVKIFIAIKTNSLAIISSLVDSAVDLLISVILLWTGQAMKNRDIYKYPEGRKRLEPIVIVILSVIMCSASVIIIIKSVETLDQDVQYFTHQNDPTSTRTLPNITVNLSSILVMVLAVISKAVLFVLCYRIKNPTMHALAEANLNDVVSNAAALICGVVASEAYHYDIQREAVVIDPIGGILISVYITIAWIIQASRQVRRLTGISAEPYFLQLITHVAYNYRPDVIKKIRFVQAVYHGTHFFVEIHIGLPASMPLSNAHDIGTELQNQLETIEDVERAFVHLDFESEQSIACDDKDL